MSNFNYITKEDKTKDLFWKLPKQFILEPKYKKMKDSAKILYTILYDRTNQSIENNWFDENDHAYIICTFDEIQTLFGSSRDKVNNALKDLEKFELLKKAKIKNNNGDMVNVFYMAHAETTDSTLKSLVEQHKKDYHELRDKNREYKKEYRKKQTELNKLKREKAKLKNAESENQTPIENTSFYRVKGLQLSNFNGSPKIRLRGVRKSDYNNTEFNKNYNSVCTYVEIAQKYFLLGTKEKNRITYAYKDKVELELFEQIFINSKNKNKTIGYVFGTLDNLLKENVTTLEKFENQLQEFAEKMKNNKNNKNKGTVKLKTRFHNINQSFTKYTPEELEKHLQEQQKDKFHEEDKYKKTGFHNFDESLEQYDFDEIEKEYKW